MLWLGLTLAVALVASSGPIGLQFHLCERRGGGMYPF